MESFNVQSKEIRTIKVCTHDYFYRDKHFVLCYFPELNQYGAIPFENIEDGHLKHPMNGLQLRLSAHLKDTIKLINYHLDVQYYKSQGMTSAQAQCKVLGIPYKPELEPIL